MPPKKKPQKKQDGLKVPGFSASGIVSGIKKNGRKDLALILSDSPAAVSAMFTTNKVKAAPVLLDMKLIKRGISRGVVINSGNANACTGAQGYKDALAMTKAVEDALKIEKGAIMAASTGVIGVPLPIEKIRSGVGRLVDELNPDGLRSANEAIMTTDAFPKGAVARARIGGRTITIAGIAKGAGMICPNMATMLAFFMTDANIKNPSLERALRQAVDLSFNSIIVDNDTSTNDTVMIFANGFSGGGEIRTKTPGFKAFQDALTGLCVELSKMIVRDGEGATRFIEINVNGAASGADARKAARTVAESFLVKTAFFGGDPNWGRILAALGRAGIRMREDRTDISFNGVPVVRSGLDTGNEKKAADAIKVKDVNVSIDLNMGSSPARLWTSDLSYKYVEINSAYRT